jgi:hypothetical protein
MSNKSKDSMALFPRTRMREQAFVIQDFCATERVGRGLSKHKPCTKKCSTTAIDVNLYTPERALSIHLPSGFRRAPYGFSVTRSPFTGGGGALFTFSLALSAQV